MTMIMSPSGIESRCSGSGSGAELLAWADLDADHVVTAARRLVEVRRRSE